MDHDCHADGPGAVGAQVEAVIVPVGTAAGGVVEGGDVDVAFAGEEVVDAGGWLVVVDFRRGDGWVASCIMTAMSGAMKQTYEPRKVRHVCAEARTFQGTVTKHRTAHATCPRRMLGYVS